MDHIWWHLLFRFNAFHPEIWQEDSQLRISTLIQGVPERQLKLVYYFKVLVSSFEIIATDSSLNTGDGIGIPGNLFCFEQINYISSQHAWQVKSTVR